MELQTYDMQAELSLETLYDVVAVSKMRVDLYTVRRFSIVIECIYPPRRRMTADDHWLCP